MRWGQSARVTRPHKFASCRLQDLLSWAPGLLSSVFFLTKGEVLELWWFWRGRCGRHWCFFWWWFNILSIVYCLGECMQFDYSNIFKRVETTNYIVCFLEEVGMGPFCALMGMDTSSFWGCYCLHLFQLSYLKQIKSYGGGWITIDILATMSKALEMRQCRKNRLEKLEKQNPKKAVLYWHILHDKAAFSFWPYPYCLHEAAV